MESKALSNILERNSPRQLIEPHPNAEQMKLVYEAALRALIMAGLDRRDLLKFQEKG